MHVLQLQADAPWRQRFRAPRILWTQLARAAPTRGLALGTHSGATQLYAWDVATGALRQLTDRPHGVVDGRIAPDGRFVYYFADRQGNEIGHFVRVAFEGGAAVDLTPELQPYATRGGTISRAGNLLAFTLANRDGHQLWCAALGPGDAVGSLRLIHQSPHEFWAPVLSYDGTLAVIPSTARAGNRHFSLVAVDTTRGTQVAELWDGPGTTAERGVFSPVLGDERLLATTNRTGVARPLLWTPRTGERVDIPLDDLAGEVFPVDWSHEGRRVLLSR